MLIRSLSFQEKKSTGVKKIKGTHFIGVRVGCLKVIEILTKFFFSQKMSIFIFSIKLT